MSVLSLSNSFASSARPEVSLSTIQAAACRLDCLLRLEQAVIKPGESRKNSIQRVAQKVESLWREFHDRSPEELGRQFVGSLPDVVSCYEDFKLHDTSEISQRIMRDVASLIVSPMEKSHRGDKGPTFLVAHPFECAPFDQPPQIERYVQKYTHWNELCMNSIYRMFGCLFEPEDVDSHGLFIAPASCGLDLQNLQYWTCESKLEKLDSQPAAELSANYERILKQGAPGRKPEDPHIMLSERIEGENLLYFALTRYAELNEDQKTKLFSHLARIALLDVILGNLDRLVQIYTDDSGNYYLDNELLESNLGNVMFACVGSEAPQMYAIDNCVDDELIKSEEKIERYREFLRELFSQPDWQGRLIENMQGSLIRACNTQIDDCEGNREKLRKNLLPFVKELQSEKAISDMKDGFEEMAFFLWDDLIPSWMDAELFRNSITQAYPELCKAVSERLELFISMRPINAS